MMVLALALCASCAAKKPVVQQSVSQPVQTIDPQQAKLDSLKKAAEIRKLELEIQAMEAEAISDLEIKKLKAQNAMNATRKILGQRLVIPCIDDSYDVEGEYMAGLGIAENEIERGAGMTNANRYAIADIASRYIGMIKNGVSQYAKNVNTRSGQKVKENELEGAAEAIGTKMIDKYAMAVCRDFEQDDFGSYTCYVAIHVPVKEVLKATVDEVGVIQTDLDRQKFREYMEKELNQQAAAAQAEKDELMKLREEMK